MLIPGVTQLVWVLPLAMWARHRRDTLIGVLATAGVVFLLNATCWVTLPFAVHPDLFEGTYTELDAPPAR